MRPRFTSGWHRSFERLLFLFRLAGYLLQPKRYPLFFVRPSKNGLLKTFRIERKLGMNKSVRYDGRVFFSFTVPGYPSRAFDYAVARGALNIGGAGTASKSHVDNAILGITSRCEYSCAHCYEKRNIRDEECVPVDRWEAVIRDLQEIGVSVLILSGGEPMLRYDDLLRLVRSGDKDRSDFHLHTSGFGVTAERAHELKDAGLTAAAVGLDDVNPKRLDALRGRSGAFDTAIAAVEHFSRADVFTYLNLCLTPALVRSGDLWEYFEMANRLNVGIIEILEPRPCGGFQGRSMDGLFTAEDRLAVAEFVRLGNSERRYRNHPLLYSVVAMEAPDRMGCMMGGLSHFSIDSSGNVIPCVFVPISFGNILKENLPVIFARMRQAVPSPIHKGCGSVLLADLYSDGKDGATAQFKDVREAWDDRLARGTAIGVYSERAF